MGCPLYSRAWCWVASLAGRGDFNAIVALDEYLGVVSPDLASISYFSDFISQCGFHELPMSGGTFTWSGVRSRGRVLRKLDRLLFNTSWLSSFPGRTIELLRRVTSDHSPLFYKFNLPRTPGLCSFKFQNI